MWVSGKQWQCLLLMIEFQLSGEHQGFENLVSATVSLLGGPQWRGCWRWVPASSAHVCPVLHVTWWDVLSLHLHQLEFLGVHAAVPFLSLCGS